MFKGAKSMVGPVLGALVLLAASCGGGGAERQSGPLVVDGERIAGAQLWSAAQDEGELTLYTALSETREIALTEAFEEQVGLDVEIVRLPGGRLFERVQSEHGAGQLGADVIRHTDLTLVREHQEAGVWQPHCPPNWDQLDDELREPDCNYWVSQVPIYAIGYNTELVSVDEAPRTWQDLLDPQWRGRVGLAHIGAGGSTWSREFFLRERYGVEYWERLAAQRPFITGGAGAVTEQNARGEFEVAMVLPGTQSIAAQDGAPLEVVIPSDGVPGYGQWIGLAAGAANPNAGKVFLNWQASMAGQRAVAEQAGDYPVVDGAPAPRFLDRTLPSREEIDLVFVENRPGYQERREPWMAEWFTTFGYQPEGDG